VFLDPMICHNECPMIASLLCVLVSVLSIPGAMEVRHPGADSCPPVLDALWLTPVAGPRRQPRSETGPAKGRLLIAARSLVDPNFSETVVLLLAHDARGAMGVVINRPTDVRLASALPNMAELSDRPDRVFLGGPVAGNMMVLLIRSKNPPESSRRVFGDVYTSGSLAALRQAIGRNGKTERVRTYAGHAGWAPGQLEHEIARGDWIVAAADAATVFDTPPAKIWHTLIDRFSGQWARWHSGPLKKAFRSPFDRLRVSGKPCGASVFPLMLSLSKHERALFQRAVSGAEPARRDPDPGAGGGGGDGGAHASG
jgi:putative transcriptional regulator